MTLAPVMFSMVWMASRISVITRIVPCLVASTRVLNQLLLSETT